jgi:hypothetical protein
VVVILALVGVIIWLVLSTAKGEGDKRDVLVTDDNIEVAVEGLQEPKNDFRSYTVKMNNVWHFKTGSSESEDAHVENIPENATDVYFDLFEETDEENAIYQSPIIPRGQALEHFALDKPLSAGTHNCIMVYHLVDENQETLSTLRVRVTLEVEG